MKINGKLPLLIFRCVALGLSLGVVCLIVYKYSLPENWLLICSMVLEVGGIFAYIFINKKRS